MLQALNLSKVKSFLAFILYYSGVLPGYLRYKLKNKAFILMYHRIIDKDLQSPFPVQPGMYVTPDNFGKQVKFLKDKFKIISLDVLVERLKNGEDVSGCCVLTFDDGWRDNYTNAFPILKKHQVPATIFLATGFIDTQKWFWPEEVSLSLAWLYQNKMDSSKLLGILQKLFDKSQFYSCGLPCDAIDRFIDKLKQYEPQQRERVVAALKDVCPATKHERILMNWNEVQEMANSGLISFGAHTVSHTLLDQLTVENARYEIKKSKEDIEKRIEKQVNLFAFPNGNYNKKVLAILRDTKFAAAVTTRRGYIDMSTHLLELPRIAMHDDISYTLPLFLWRLLIR